MKHRKLQTQFPKLRKSSALRQKKETSMPSRNYFLKSMQIIDEKNCYDNDRLIIDGGYGDYRMSIFRVKDRKKRQNEPTSVLTPDYVKSCQEAMPKHLTSEFHQIINKPNEDYLQNPEQQTQVQEQKPKLTKWIAEEDEHLCYRYAPDHQIQKWFSSVEISNGQKISRKESELRSTENFNRSLISSTKKTGIEGIRYRRNRGKPNQAVFMFRYMDEKRSETEIKKNEEGGPIKKSLHVKFESRVKKLEYD